jgi:hypothetical protein
MAAPTVLMVSELPTGLLDCRPGDLLFGLMRHFSIATSAPLASRSVLSKSQ